MSKRFTVPAIASSEITPHSVYLNRRNFMQAGAAATLAATGMLGTRPAIASASVAPLDYNHAQASDGAFYTGEQLTPENDVTSYGNFYEFGTDKGDPAKYAHKSASFASATRVDAWHCSKTCFRLSPRSLAPGNGQFSSNGQKSLVAST